ncbi:hypothetical protein [Thermococcus stetteri]|uniref:hypothetical protein n=1 Tax=Thermococcus stetteri TaxID=49900 RepID=UPI001AE755C2|nr:hypothetical protein [Thermococcus stetteri]MBP1912778.1 hypothetical protein [Thermococcus stetteri]
MKRWTFVLPFIYFLFLFALAFMDFPRQINRQWMWVQIGGLIFTFVLGGYLDGSIPEGKLTAIGAFTLLWLALAFIINIRREYFMLLGLVIELALVVLIEKIL